MKKKCFKCGEEKYRAAFYRAPKMADGRSGKCRECTRIDQKAYRVKKGRAHFREYNRAYRARMRWEYAEADYIRERARATVRSMVEKGWMIKPTECSSCGSTGTLDAHHENYEARLEVTWLCRQCHARLHMEERGES